MRLTGFVITAAVVAGFSGPAFAQGSGQPAAATTNPPVTTSSDNPRGWMAAGFIGTNFNSSRNGGADLSAIENLNTNNSTSVNFGGQVGYVARGVIGGEFLADFSPGLGTLNNALFSSSPDVNSYMFNLIAVAPFGQYHRTEPYVSGGIGAVTLRGDIFTSNPVATPHAGNAIATESVRGTRFGWNLGGGVMAWSERNWGFRGDVRYYRTTSDTTDVLDLNNIDTTTFTRVELSGISFWKANAGIAFRW